jgi:PAS domain S-box-containing protein
MKDNHKLQAGPATDKSSTEHPRSQPSSPLNVKHQQILSRHLPIGIVETSLEGRYIDVSEEFCRMLGYQREELLRRGIKDVTQEDDYQLDIRLYSQLVAGDLPYYKIEKRFERKDGQIIWVHLMRSAVRDDGGKILYLVGIALDITERHVTQEALRESEWKFSLIFDKLPFSATLARAQDGRILDVNENFETLFEYSKDQAIGKTLLELGLIPNVEGRKRILAELFERGSLRGVELVLTTRSRGTRIFLANMDLVEIGGESCILQTDQDITETKRALAALQESEERFRAILRQAAAGIVRKDPVGMLMFVNDEFCRMVGYSSVELISTGMTCWDLTHPEDLEENQRLFNRMMQDAVPFQMERRLIRKDGSILWCNLSVAPVLDAEGKALSSVGVEVDITPRKEAEESLRQLNLELESRVEERTAELRNMNQALQKSRRRLQVLSQRLVHVQEEERHSLARELHDQVGQTLIALNLNLTIVQGELSGGYTASLATRLADSIELVTEVIRLVRDVMSNLRPINLDAYGLESALQTYAQEFETRYGIPVQFEKRTPPLPRLDNNIEITLLRISQEALTNIARHAQANQASLSLRLDEKNVYLTIEDNGTGIASLEGDKRPRSHGLKIMQERAEALEGTLAIRSAPGQGTTIQAIIPLTPRDPDATHQEAPL